MPFHPFILLFRCYAACVKTRFLGDLPENVRFNFILTQHIWTMPQNCCRALYLTPRTFRSSTLFLECACSGFLCSICCITTAPMPRPLCLNLTSSKSLGSEIRRSLWTMLQNQSFKNRKLRKAVHHLLDPMLHIFLGITSIRMIFPKPIASNGLRRK